MTNVDDALKQFARDSADAAADQDLRDVTVRAARSRRARATQVLTAIGAAAAVAAMTTVVFVLSTHNPITDSSPQLGRSTREASQPVRCPVLGVRGPATTFTASGFSGQCVVRVLGLEGLGSISPPTAIAPVGSLDEAEALLETAAFYQYAPGIVAGTGGTVREVLAGYGTVSTESGVGAVHYDGVNSWVLAWRVTGLQLHCRISTQTAGPSTGASDEWHFLVVPSDGQAPKILDAATQRCGSQQPANVETVFRHVRPTVDSRGNYPAYVCPPDVSGDSGSGGGSSNGSSQTVDIIVGIPVGASRCKPETKHVSDFDPATTIVVGPPGEVRGWPAGIARLSAVSPVPTSVTTSSAADARCAVGSSSVTDDVTQAFADHCVQKALNVDGIATVSPAQGVPPGTLAAAEDLLASASSDFSEAGGLVSFAPPTSTSDVHAESVGRIPPVKQVIAAYGFVTAHGPLPGAAAAGYADVAAWVLAWKTTPKSRHCPGVISNVTPSQAPAPLGPLADWHFLVVPSDGHPPLVLEPRADNCSLRADAKVGRVFRREQPAISATGDLRAYNCGGDATTLEFASVTDVDGRLVLEAPVGVPVDMTGCVVKTENLGADWGAATPAPAGPLGGWPSWLPKP